MKYNEAIDMILDGGLAHQKSWRENGRDAIGFDIDGWLKRIPAFIDKWHKEDFTATDWIVEKDGVVYEEYPLRNKLNNIVSSIDKNKIYLPDLDEIHLPIIADEVNEEWLEKKMLCFMNKHIYLVAGYPIKLKDRKCSDYECPFCFPEEKLVTNDEDSTEAIKALSEGLKARSIDKEETPEKVTAYEHIIAEIDYLRDCAYQRGACNMYYMPDAEHEKLSELRKKLEYLVSLQEK